MFEDLPEGQTHYACSEVLKSDKSGCCHCNQHGCETAGGQGEGKRPCGCMENPCKHTYSHWKGMEGIDDDSQAQEWEEEFDDKWDDCISWKVGFLDNYRGGNKQCSHDLRSEHRKARKILKDFIRTLLSSQREAIIKEVERMINEFVDENSGGQNLERIAKQFGVPESIALVRVIDVILKERLRGMG